MVGGLFSVPFRIGVLLVVLFCVSALPFSAAQADFTADLRIQEKGQKEITGKIYFQENKIRQELTEEGEKQIMIFRPDKGVIWMITPEEEMYMEMPYQADNKRFERWSEEREKEARLVGNDTVSGFACKKYEIEEDGEKTSFCISDRLPLPLRVEFRDGSMEYRNIVEGTIPDSMFEVPAEYEKMVMPMAPEAPQTGQPEVPEGEQ